VIFVEDKTCLKVTLIIKPWITFQTFQFVCCYCMGTLTRHSLHGLLICEIGGLDCCVNTAEYISRVHWIHNYLTRIL